MSEEEQKKGIWIIVRFGLRAHLGKVPYESKEDFLKEHDCLKMDPIFDYLVPTGPAPGGGLTRGVAVLPVDMFDHPTPAYVDLTSGVVYTFIDDLHKSDQQTIDKLREAALKNQQEARAKKSGLVTGNAIDLSQFRRQ